MRTVLKGGRELALAAVRGGGIRERDASMRIFTSLYYYIVHYSFGFLLLESSSSAVKPLFLSLPFDWAEFKLELPNPVLGVV